MSRRKVSVSRVIDNILLASTRGGYRPPMGKHDALVGLPALLSSLQASVLPGYEAVYRSKIKRERANRRLQRRKT